MNEEQKRLEDARLGRAAWREWGPYLSDRQWGTVREDYSPGGTAWESFSHDMARARAYRWGEDGLGGVSDAKQRLCLAPALWNGQDPILKERLFGLTGNEGNHGEDVKELYYYLDSTPTHSYMKMLYKYPQRAFPYQEILEGNLGRTRADPEYELMDTGAFEGGRYFDVFIEYAKAGPQDILCRITAHNRGGLKAPLEIIPQLWFRNTWTWDPGTPKPHIIPGAGSSLYGEYPDLGACGLAYGGAPELLFCENESNPALWGMVGKGVFKDAFHRYIVAGDRAAVGASPRGTKAGLRYRFDMEPGASAEVRLRLSLGGPARGLEDFDAIFEARRTEADAFYGELQAKLADPDKRLVQRQAFAGMLWSKQFYGYDVRRWISGDPGQPPPPAGREEGRNHLWQHLHCADVISMPDKWEYPWFAAWDLAFQCIPLGRVDPDFAKQQLLLLTREWYMHPNGQLPAYEWAFGDVNPPVHAMAAWQVYRRDAAATGKPDLDFLERIFQKLCLNFTWWVNRKDTEGNNIFEGGFLGLDNIGIFDRSAPLPGGGTLEQADGTSWMAMYCLDMLRMALELAQTRPAYEDMATKFFEHFLYIAQAMTKLGGGEGGLWNEEDGFYFDVLRAGDGSAVPLKIFSAVGLAPLFAVATLEPALVDRLPGFKRHMEWFLTHRPDLAALVSRWKEPGQGDLSLLSLLRGHRMTCLLNRMLDEAHFLSGGGVRSLSKIHQAHPYKLEIAGQDFSVDYEPAESRCGTFGGNSNWRGPVWMPLNFMLVDALNHFHGYYGDDFKVECPVGSGRQLTLQDVAKEITRRVCSIFLDDAQGRRPVFGQYPLLRDDPNFKDMPLFFEYFDGDTGHGLGASHQTGWTGLVALLLDESP
jgi:hypothetical protein